MFPELFLWLHRTPFWQPCLKLSNKVGKLFAPVQKIYKFRTCFTNLLHELFLRTHRLQFWKPCQNYPPKVRFFSAENLKTFEHFENFHEKFSAWNGPSGHADVIFGNTNQTTELLLLKTRNFSDFSEKPIKMFLWNSVSRMWVFV